MKGLVEICCQSFEGVQLAEKLGADQVELNSGLYLGGLTPSFGLVKRIKRELSIPVMAMVRPRPGGFNYSYSEYLTILEDVECLLEVGVDGIVFGALDKNFAVDLEKSREIIKMVKGKDREVVFHRAFDQVDKPREQLEHLIDIGVDRVLTSGQQNTAIEGLDLLRDLNNSYGEKIDILLASGVSSKNVERLYLETGIKNFHSSCRTWRKEGRPRCKDRVSFSYDEDHKDSYEVIDKKLVEDFIESVRNL